MVISSSTRTRSFLGLALIFFMAVLPACNSDTRVDDLTPQNVKSIWRDLLGKYGVTPTFPVGGGIQPGDVYTMCGSAPKGETATISEDDLPEPERVWSLDLRKDLGKYYASRYPYHFISGNLGSTTLSAMFSPTAPNATPSIPLLAAFPDISGSNANAKRFSAALPAGVAEIKAGGAATEASYYLISVPGAEVLALPRLDLQQAVWNGSNTSTVAKLEELRSAFGEENDCGNRRAVLKIVGTTYYVRSLTVASGKTRADAWNALASVRMPTGSTRAATAAALGAASAPQATSVTISVSSTNTSMMAAQQNLNNVIAQADLLPSSTSPTISFGSGSSSNSAVAMKFDFLRPLAIGAKLHELSQKEPGVFHVGAGSGNGSTISSKPVDK